MIQLCQVADATLILASTAFLVPHVRWHDAFFPCGTNRENAVVGQDFCPALYGSCSYVQLTCLRQIHVAIPAACST